MGIQVAPRVLGIPVGERDNVVYLVTGEKAAVFIDAGYDVQADVDSLAMHWDDAGRPPVAAIVVTHRHLDHAGGVRRLAGATGGVVTATAEEKPHIEEAFPERRRGQDGRGPGGYGPRRRDSGVRPHAWTHHG